MTEDNASRAEVANVEEKRAELVPLVEEEFRITNRWVGWPAEAIHREAVDRVQETGDDMLVDLENETKRSIKKERLFQDNPDVTVEEIESQLDVSEREARQLRNYFDDRSFYRGEYSPGFQRLLAENTVDIDPRKGDLRDQLPALLQGREGARIQATPQQLLKLLESVEFPQISAGPINLNPGVRNTKADWVGDSLRITGRAGASVKMGLFSPFHGERFSVDLRNSPVGLVAENVNYQVPNIPGLTEEKKAAIGERVEGIVGNLDGLVKSELNKRVYDEDRGEGFAVAGLRIDGRKLQVDFKKVA